MEYTNNIILNSYDRINYTIYSNNVDNISQYKKYYNINKILKSKTISPRFRLFILNQDETIKEQIPPKDILSGGSYGENYQNGTRRTLSFTLNNNSGKYNPSANKFWINTKLSLQVGLEIPPYEGDIIWFDKGVFVINNINPSKTSNDETVSINCSDKFSIFEGRQGSSPVTTEIDVGEDIEEIIQNIQNQPLYKGTILDPKPMYFHKNFKGMKLPIKLSIPSGGLWSSLLLQIADILSAEIFYDVQGVLNIVPTTETIEDWSKPVIDDLTIENMANESFQFNVNDVVNCIYVVGANVNGHTCVAKAVNEDPESPINIDRIGLKVGDIINDSNITDDILAKERANYELRKKIVISTSLPIQTRINPIHTVNNIVTVTEGDTFKFKKERFLIQSVNFSLDYGGQTSLTLSNLHNFSFFL